MRLSLFITLLALGACALPASEQAELAILFGSDTTVPGAGGASVGPTTSSSSGARADGGSGGGEPMDAGHDAKGDASEDVDGAGDAHEDVGLDGDAEDGEAGLGDAGPVCMSGGGCAGNADCATIVPAATCVKGLCVQAHCTNGVKDADETDKDCGGANCPPCDPGRACLIPPDCVSLICAGGTCTAPSCTDHKQNGDETGVDCGNNGCDAGPVCPPCQ